MAHVRCPKHGGQIAFVFCEHAADAVEAGQPMRLYLQKSVWTGIASAPIAFVSPKRVMTRILWCASRVWSNGTQRWAATTWRDVNHHVRNRFRSHEQKDRVVAARSDLRARGKEEQ